jgi:phage/plasmid-associated DNA primase
VRFLTAGEPPKGAKINEPLINSVTGGDPMLARDNFRSFFRFMPIFKFTLWCNDCRRSRRARRASGGASR